MAQIRISPDQMRQRVGEYRTERDNVEQCINKMNTLLDNLQQEWEGDASRSYKERYERDLKPSFIKAKDMIEEIAKALENTANEMEEMDRHISDGFKA